MGPVTDYCLLGGSCLGVSNRYAWMAGMYGSLSYYAGF
ncbi:hypothetical protein ARUE_c43310 [Arthrobacter sp. Rue61a]|nr:hypothetical protein ARUE_c43310 [Arthrobacter sp. Rue61a]